jgi:rhodanese-related sulfurtransferase
MTRAAIDDLEPAEVKRLLDAGLAHLIDVREPAEYAAEHIPGAELHPLSAFNAATLPAGDGRRIVFHCGSARRSLEAAEKFLAAGHRRAAQLRGGLKAWKDAGLPVVAPK